MGGGACPVLPQRGLTCFALPFPIYVSFLFAPLKKSCHSSCEHNTRFFLDIFLHYYTFFLSCLPSPVATGCGGGAREEEETEAVRGLPEVSMATGLPSVLSTETVLVVVGSPGRDLA